MPLSRWGRSLSTFTAHNIALDDGTFTKPGQLPVAELPWWSAARRTLNLIFPHGFAGLRVADLACLEGGYTVELARLGFGEALGIEVRQSNFDACMLVKNGTNLPNLKFVQDDVWNLARYGEFDAIFCCGILYHLSRPRAFIKLMSQATRRAILINTHFATVTPIAAHNLSPITTNEGLPGRWFPEPGSASDAARWSSWGNEKSFWIQKEFLIQAIRDAGFPLVFEQYDHLGNDIGEAMQSGYYKQQNRGMFSGVRDAALANV